MGALGEGSSSTREGGERRLEPPSKSETGDQGKNLGLRGARLCYGDPFLPPPPSLTPTHGKLEMSGNQEYTVAGAWGEQTDGEP